MFKRKNLAIIGVGIIGTGSLDQGIPAMLNGLAALRERYSITLYSFISVDKSKAPTGIRVRCISNKKINLKIQYIFLVFQFVKDHLLNNFDLIHAQSPYPAGVMSAWLNKFFQIPWILSLHAGETICLPEVPFGDLLNPRLRKAAFEVCSEATLLMTLTQYQAHKTRENLKLERPILVLHRGVATSVYSEKYLGNPIRFLHISNYHPIKDYVTLLKTFSLLAKQIPCELIIAGSNYGSIMEELIQSMELESKVKLIGAVSHENIIPLFSQAHILLHTSKYESQGMVVLEAMANGVVVCGTHVGIMADLSGKYCVTVPLGEYSLLAAKIINLINDESRFQHIRQQAYAYAKEHDLNWYVAELEKIYSNAIDLNRK